MTRQLRPATPRHRRRLQDALEYLREARKCLVDADCPSTLKKVASSIKSAEGAQRHMQRRLGR